jgi:WD40 repeat protein
VLGGNTVLMSPMREPGLRDAIERPLDAVGLRAEPGLVETIIADTLGSREVLPLLQTALLATWERRHGDELTIEGYRASGGVAGAIARLAEEMYADLSPSEAAAAERLFVRLVDVDRGGAIDLRRRVDLHELSAVGHGPDQATTAALAAGVRHRLVIVDEGTVEITHEALVREWPRLARWIEDDRDGHRLHQRLADSARAWLASGNDPSELLRGARLEAVDHWASSHSDHLNDAERDLLAASRASALAELDDAERRSVEQARANARLRRRLVLSGALLVVAVVATSVAGWQWQRQRSAATDAREASADAAAEADSARVAQREAESARDDAEAQTERALSAEDTAEAAQLSSDAQRLGASALVDQRVDRALLSAVASVRLDDRPETRAGLVAAIQRAPLATAIGRLPNERRPQSITISPDGSQVLVTDNGGLVHVLDAATLDALGTLDGGWGMRFLDDGNLVVAAIDSTDLRIVDPLDPDPSVVLAGGSFGTTFVDADLGAGRVVADLRVGLFGIAAWDIANPGSPIATHVYGAEVRGVALVDDGRSALVVGAGRRPAEIVDLDAGLVTATFEGSGAIALSPDRRVFATVERGNALRVAVYETGATEPVSTFSVSAAVTALAMSPDGDAVAVGTSDGTSLYHVDGTLLLRLDGQAERSRGVAFAPDGTSLFGISLDGTIVRWDLTGTVAGVRWTAMTDGLFGPDDDRFTSYLSAQGDVAMPANDGTRGDILVVAGLDDDVRLRLLTEHRLPQWQGGINVVAWAPDASRFATGAGDARMRLWDTASGSLLADWAAPLARSVTAVAFDPTGALLYVGLGNDPLPADAVPGPDVLVLDADTLETVNSYELAAMESAPSTLAVLELWPDPSGRELLVSCCGDDESALTAIDLVGGDVVWERAERTYSVAFAPDGQHLAVADGDGALRVVRSVDGDAVAGPVDAHDGWADTVGFSADGSMLVSGGTDGLTRIWRSDDLAALGTYDVAAGRKETVVPSIFDDQGERVLIFDGTKMWDVPVDAEAIVDQVCRVIGRDLTPDEWATLAPDQPYRSTCA